MGGATHNAVQTEIGNKGHADKFLVVEDPKEAESNFWRFLNDKHSAFAQEPIDFDATASQPKFGGSAKFTFPRQGDLAWQTYAKIQLPAIVSLKDGQVQTGDNAAQWNNAIGQRLLRQVTLAIGGTVIDSLTDTYMYCDDVLTTKAGKELGDMIGKFSSKKEQQNFARRSRTLQVPLRFSFARSSQLALPIAALSFHAIVLEIDFCSRIDAIINPSHGQVCVRPNNISDEDLQTKLDAGQISLSPLTDSDLHCTVESNQIYLEDAERDLFGKQVFSQLVDEVQIIPSQAQFGGQVANENTPSVRHTVRLQFNNSVQEYIFVVRPEGREGRDQFDFSGPVDKATGELLDPIREVTVKFNNTPRVQTRPGQYFRRVVPYQYHTKNNQNDFIQVWSFAQNPESLHGTGGANHSRIDNINMELALDPRVFSPEQPNAEVLCFAKAKNVLTYKFGMVQKKLQ